MNSQCSTCASDLEPGAVVCVHCGNAVNPALESASAEPLFPISQEASAPISAPVPRPVDNRPAYVMDNDLTGISGWLILVAISLAAGPFFRIHGILVDARFLFNSQFQAAITRPGLEAILFYELVTNSFFMIIILLLNFLFYTKRKSFPTFMIFNLAAQLVAQLIDHLWAMHFSSKGAPAVVIQAGIAAAIGIPYMLNSIRVEQTFVN